MTATIESKLVKNQVKKYDPVFYTENGQPCAIIAEVRHDDSCGNGHNSFGITAEVYEAHRQPHEPTIKTPQGKTLWLNSCGCQHEEVAKHFPELAPLIKWHLSSTDGPMHYTANALYWAGHSGYRRGQQNDPPNLEHLKSTIVFGALASDPDCDLVSFLWSDAKTAEGNKAAADGLKGWLESRLAEMLEAFKTAVESIGLEY